MAGVRGKILKCTGLKNVDLWGKSDPYVKLTLEDAKGEIHGDMKTSTKTDDLDPTWDDEAFSFAPEGPHLLDCSLRFRVNDTGLGPEVELGEALVPLKLVPLMEEGGEEKLFEFSLGIAHGKAPLGMITVQIGVVPSAGWFS